MSLSHSRAEIDALKSRILLSELFRAHGIEVTHKGRSRKALCPWHQEKTPSLSVDSKKGLYHCFSCGKSGDHLSFLEEHVGLTFPKAVEELQRLTGQIELAPPPPPEEELFLFPHELLERLAEVWHQAFCQRSEGLAYLESRSLKDKEMMRLFQIGYCDGEKLLAITTAQEREHLQRAGVINERGKELFSHCVVLPLRDSEGRVTGFYGRAVLPRAKVPHRYCAGPKTGLFYPQAARGAQRVFLVEGALDALAFYQAGFPNVMAMGGTQGFNEALLAHLKREKVAELVLCLDGDQAGQAAATELEARLKSEGFAVSQASLPAGQDPLSFLPSLSQAELDSRLRPQPPPAPAVLSACPAPMKRSYKKLSGAQGKLKVWVSLESDGQRAEATLDLYSSRGRRQEAINLGRRLGLEIEEVEEWFFSILRELEEQKSGADHSQELFRQVEVVPMTPAERRLALDFLCRPNLVEAILADMETLGYMGEEEAKLLGYCVSVSRKLERPMSAIIQSGSGAGKSYLAEIIQSVTPPEDVVFYSRLSQQALYHMPKDYLVHKLLQLEERVGGESCDYQIRSLQSSAKLVQAIVVKDPASGQLFTRENEVHGPIAYIETTTNLRLNPENTSRCFEIPLDESPEQTRRIHQRQKDLKGLERLSRLQSKDAILQRHHHAQRLLEPIFVVIPYVDLLTFPDLWLRTRRDHDRYLHLIEVLTYLHQHQRPHKVHEGAEYIEATVADYRWAYFLAHRVLRSSLDELSRWSRELLGFFEANAIATTRRQLREQLQWPDRRTREALEELVELEYLEVSRGACNLCIYRLSTLKDAVSNKVLGLLHPDDLEARWTARFDRFVQRGQTA